MFGVKLFGEVVGAHHEHGEPGGGGSDLPGVEDRRRCLDHRPDRGVLRGATVLQRLLHRVHVRGGGDLGDDDTRRAGLGHGPQVGGEPLRIQAVDPDREFSTAVVS
jgi:hypothetical protein